MIKKLLKNLYKTGNDDIECNNPNDVIYNCTIQKAGSTWIDNLLQDNRTYKYTGLKVVPYKYNPSSIQESPVPFISNRTFATRLYLDYSTYQKIIKPLKYKTFYVTRDPRDIVVSWYFSVKYSHVLNPIIAEVRKKLLDMNEHDGIIYSIKYLSEYGAFKAQHSWLNAEAHDPNVRIFRYEDLINDEFKSFKAIFEHCDIQIPEDVFQSIIRDHLFKNRAKREKGIEDVNSQMRKGISGDWENHFSVQTIRIFKDETNDLLIKQGYERDMEWTK